jgi:hypothetical protein
METIANDAKCARCGKPATDDELLRPSLPSVNAFVAIGVTTDAEDRPLDHHDLIDRSRYCQRCRRIINLRRIGACCVLGVLSLVAAWLAAQLF